LKEDLFQNDPENSPAGLSSHGLTQVTPKTFVITGREGSVRFQKRFASVFNLEIDEKDESYQYSRSSLQVDSRSGHSSSIVPNFTRSARKSSPAVIVIGGRNADTIDSIPLKSYSPIQLPEFDSSQNKILSEVGLKLQPIKSAFRLHAVVVVNNFILLHGGRVFNRMRNDVIGDKEISIYDSSSSRWFSAKINACSQKLCLKRFGHSLSSIDGKLYILGGALNDEECTDQMIELEFHT